MGGDGPGAGGEKKGARDVDAEDEASNLLDQDGRVHLQEARVMDMGGKSGGGFVSARGGKGGKGR